MKRNHATLKSVLGIKGLAHLNRVVSLLFLVGLCIGLTGCFGLLKPDEVTSRHFVLTTIPSSDANRITSNSMAVAVGQVRVPAYLLNTLFAVRKGTNEVEYLPAATWAERLDSGLQRVLAANLGILLPTDRVYQSAWQRDAVSAEVYVVIEQFDVDKRGRGVLVARWRALTPGGEQILKTGRSELAREGPPPETEIAGAVATLSSLVADLSQQLAQVLRETNAHQAVSNAK